MTNSSEHRFEECVDGAISEFYEVLRERTGSQTAAVSDPAGAKAPKKPFVPPKRVGPYAVLGVIGKGGLGIILRAKDNKLGREIAIKLIREEHAQDPELLQQFFEEARVTSRLQHPGVVPIHQAGRTEEDLPYFTMKVVEGETLAKRLADRETPTARRRRFLQVFEKVCDTVAFAHSKGVVHRDLKPANVMVGAFGEVQILDWGFAFPTQEGPELDPDTLPADNGDSTGSFSTRVFGTPAYMAPEQARGELSNLDPRTDVFSLGAMLCEILTGAPPYLGETRQEIYLKASHAWLEDAHKRLSACEADAPLVELAKRCMSPDPEQRPPDAARLTEEVDDYLASAEERARELEVEAAEARGRADEANRRVKVTVLLSGIIGIALLAAGAFLWWELQAREAAAVTLERAKHLAALARDGGPADPAAWNQALAAAEQAATVAAAHTGLDESATGLLASVRSEQEQARRDRRFLDWLSGSRLQLSYDLMLKGRRMETAYMTAFREWGVDLQTLSAKTAAGRIRESRIADRVVQALDRLLGRLRGADGKDPSPLLRKVCQIAIQADPDPTRNQVRRAFRDSNHAGLRSLARRADIQSASPGTLDLLARWLDPVKDGDEVIRLRRLALAKQPDDYQLVHDLEAALWRRGTRHQEFVWLSLTGVTLRPKSAHAWQHLGNAYLAAGDLSMAEAAFARMKELDPASARTDQILTRLRARQLHRQGYNVEAVRIYRHLVKMMPKDQGGQFQLAALLSDLQDPDEAARVYQQALELGETAAIRCNLGLTLRLSGRFEDALQNLERGHELGQQASRWPYPSGRWIQHVKQLQRRAAMLEGLGKSDGPKDPEERARLAMVALLRKRPWTALRLFRSAFEEEPDLGRNCRRVPTFFYTCYRFLAIEAAVQAATTTQGEAASLSEDTRRQCLDQALFWLRGELAALKELAKNRRPAFLRSVLSRLKYAPALAPVRPGEGMAQHVRAEKWNDWTSFWWDLDAAYGRAAEGLDAGAQKGAEARPPAKK